MSVISGLQVGPSQILRRLLEVGGREIYHPCHSYEGTIASQRTLNESSQLSWGDIGGVKGHMTVIGCTHAHT